MLKSLGVAFLLCSAVVLNAENGTVVDKKHHLEWQDSDDTTIDIWNMANSYCTLLQLDGKDDWRLPTKEELLSLSKDQALKKRFHNLQDRVYWTSENGQYEATTIYSGNGFVSSSDNCEKYATICVRKSN
ncbi:MAG: DUF1566 domain-containing protein [Sulfurimonas sp.]